MSVGPEIAFRRLVQRAEQRQHALAVMREHTLNALRSATRDAAAKWRFDRLVLFGSFAHGGIHERSDVDLAVWGLDPKDETKLWAHFADATGRSVDLVPMETAPAALRARVEGEGVDLGAAG